MFPIILFLSYTLSFDKCSDQIEKVELDNSRDSIIQHINSFNRVYFGSDAWAHVYYIIIINNIYPLILACLVG